MAKKGHCRSKGAGSISREASGSYMLRVMANGKRKATVLRNEDGSKCSNMEEAEMAAKRLLPVLSVQSREQLLAFEAEARGFRERARQDIGEIMRLYTSSPNYDQSIKRDTKRIKEREVRLFTEWLSDAHPEVRSISEVTREIGQEYFGFLSSSGETPSVFNRSLAVLKMVFNALREMGRTTEEPFIGIRPKRIEPPKRKEFTVEEVERIFSAFDKGFYRKDGSERIVPHKEEFRLLLLVCCYTGLRGQDATSLEWKDIDIVSRTISIVPKKTRMSSGSKVVIPLHPYLYNALCTADVARHGESFVTPNIREMFIHHRGKFMYIMRDIISLSTGLDIAADSETENGLRRCVYSLHSFRHTFVSFCANSGVPLEVVASIVGHTSSIMTRRYTHIQQETKASAISLLPSMAGSGASGDDGERGERDMLADIARNAPIETVRELLSRLQG